MRYVEDRINKFQEVICGICRGHIVCVKNNVSYAYRKIDYSGYGYCKFDSFLISLCKIKFKNKNGEARYYYVGNKFKGIFKIKPLDARNILKNNSENRG